MPAPDALAVRPAALGTTPSPVYRALAAIPERGPVLEVPMGGGGDLRGAYRETAYMLASTVHWKPIVNGYSGYAPPTYDLLAPVARRLPEPGALQELVDMTGIRWLILHEPRGATRSAWQPMIASDRLRPLAEDDEAILFEVRLPPQRDLAATLRAAVLHRPETTLQGASLAALPPGALRAAVTFPPLPARLQRGAPLRVTPAVRNAGESLWPGLGVWPDGLVVADVLWTKMDGGLVGPPAGGLRLPRDVAPGETVTLEAYLGVPREAGTYRLEVRLRQVDRGAQQSDPASLTVVVPP
jgi:hypothetical protein